jgi:hypothetical protein
MDLDTVDPMLKSVTARIAILSTANKPHLRYVVAPHSVWLVDLNSTSPRTLSKYVRVVKTRWVDIHRSQMPSPQIKPWKIFQCSLLQ